MFRSESRWRKGLEKGEGPVDGDRKREVLFSGGKVSLTLPPLWMAGNTKGRKLNIKNKQGARRKTF